MEVKLTKKQIKAALHAIGNWTCAPDVLEQEYVDKGKALLEAESILKEAAQ